MAKKVKTKQKAPHSIAGYELPERLRYIRQSREISQKDLAQKSKVRVLLCGMKLPSNYGTSYRLKFETVFEELARETNVPKMPFLLLDVANKKDLNLPDGIHPK